MKRILKLTRKDTGQHFKIPFTVEENIEKINISYTVSGDSVVDLALFDAKGFRGHSGGARKQISISVASATPGYINGTLHVGNWYVFLKAHYIVDDSCTIECQIEKIKKTKRFVYGDFHTHSVHSDGDLTILEKIENAREVGLEFLALTDHNTYTQNSNIPTDAGMLLIPGVEITNSRGHGNVFGCSNYTEVTNTYYHYKSDSIRKTLQKFIEAGYYVSINHPKGKSEEWSFDYRSMPNQLLEIWNGPDKEELEVTVNWWHEMLCNGEIIPVIGGSDFHHFRGNIRHQGRPTTAVYVKELSSAAILDSAVKGKSFITYEIHGPKAYIKDVMGQTVDKDEIVKCVFEDLQANDILVVITDQGKIMEKQIKEDINSIEYSFAIDDYAFIRLEVLRRLNESEGLRIVALSNPVYIKLEVEDE